MDEQILQSQTQPEPPTEEQLRQDILSKLPPEPEKKPESLPGSNSGKASAAARKKLAQRRAAAKGSRKPPSAPKALDVPPSDAEPGYGFGVEGFGVLYVGLVQLLAKQLHKAEFDPAKKAKLAKLADEYANARIGTIAWLAEYLPEIALLGATVAIIVETPIATSHHTPAGNPGNGQDHTGEGADIERDQAGDLRSHEPRVL